MASPFDFLNTINVTKEDIMHDDVDEKAYNAFMVNRGLSYFNDTVLMANEMNINPQLSNRQQYDFLRGIVRKRKRFSKWVKAENVDGVDAIKELYGYSDMKAMQALVLLTPDQIEAIKQKVDHGGRKGRGSKK